MRMKDKVVIVTGAAAGIGRATTELLTENGATVVGVDVDPGGRVDVRPMDVRNYDAWQSLVDDVVSEHGTIDVLVNNAGIVGAYKNLVQIDLRDWTAVLDVNLNGTFYGMRTVIPVMQAAGRGSIVNFSSIWGTVGADGVPAYQASKGAVRTLTKNAAVSFAADGIRANSIHPGLVLTPLIERQDAAITQTAIDATPLARGAQPVEIAYGVLYLASDESSFVTGTELVIDGGFLAV